MNQFVLITGASRGIGKAIAIRYAQAGYNLYLTCKKNFIIILKAQIFIEDNRRINVGVSMNTAMS